MEIFLDTANLNEIGEYKIFLDGVTTNPSIISKCEDTNYFKIIEKICELVNGSVSCEVISEEYEEMLKEAFEISSISSNICVKLPCTFNGLKVCKVLSAKGIPTNMTLCFSLTQALLAAKCGATYLSPFIGRMEDSGDDGLSLLADIIEIYKNYGYETKVLVASIRNLQHVTQASLLGAHAITMSAKILNQCFQHNLTTKGLEIFKNDWSQRKAIK